MKNMNDNWSKSNDVGVIYNKRNKQDGKSLTKLKNELKQKEDHPKDPFNPFNPFNGCQWKIK